VSAGHVGAGQATAGNFDIANFRPFGDAVYSEATRQLDPQFASQEAAFRQRMVNQGVQEGTPAFDAAYGNFERSRNDAYSSARNQALAQALGAQNQMFGQSLANEQMGLQASMANASNGLQAAGLNQADRQFGANLGLQSQMANASNSLQAAGLNQADRQFGANLGMQGQLANAQNQMQMYGLNQSDRQFGANLGYQGALANAQMGMQAQGMNQQDRQFGASQNLQYNALANAFAQQNSQFGAQMGLNYDQMNQQDRQFGANYDFGQGRADMQDLMALLGYGQQATQYNNQQLSADQQRAQALLGYIPGMTPTPIDVNGTVNQQAGINSQNAANNQANTNAQYSAAASILGSFLGSDIRIKTDISRVGTLDNGLPVYSFRYKAGGPQQIGLMAQDVEKVKPHAVAEFDGVKHVNYAEAVRG
jgi:hypothetical protein